MGFNATPMVDVIFLLTIFFMLVSRFSSAELVPMQLPEPQDSQARATHIPRRVVINCRLGAAEDGLQGVVLYSIGPNHPEPLPVIAERLQTMRARSAKMQAVIRADRRLPYADVRVVMHAIAGAGIDVLNVVAAAGEEQ